MNEAYFDVWVLMDEVRTTVDASARCGIWDSNFDKVSMVLRLELDTHLDDEKCNELCSHFPTNGVYEGEGVHGSQFMIDMREL